MATLGLSKVFILDKYFTELQKFWETEKKLQDASSSNEAVHLQRRLLSLSSELVTLRNHLHVGAAGAAGAAGVAGSAGTGSAGAGSQPAVPPRAHHLPPPPAALVPHHPAPPPPESRWRSAPVAAPPPAPPSGGAANGAIGSVSAGGGSSGADVDDLIHLRGPLTEDAVVRTLQTRFYHNKFYTMVGPILIAVNAYTDACNALTLTAARAHRPELSRLVHDAVRHQADTGYPQAIILSGVSGSGKTHASMVLLRRLFDVAGGGPETDAFKHLAAAFTVLRALGTAATPANSHSSRIGHFIEVQVTDGALYRTKIHCYFLDQTRVVRPPAGERNYHIFYQLLAGLAPDERAQLHLEGYGPQDLRYLASPQQRRAEPEDAARFHAWKTCLVILGIPFLDVVRVLAAVLLLGNVQFIENADGGAEPGGEAELAAAAALLGVAAPALLRGLRRARRPGQGAVLPHGGDHRAPRQFAEAVGLDTGHAVVGLERVGVGRAAGGRRGAGGASGRALDGGAQRRRAARHRRVRGHPGHVRLRGRGAEPAGAPVRQPVRRDYAALLQHARVQVGGGVVSRGGRGVSAGGGVRGQRAVHRPGVVAARRTAGGAGRGVRGGRQCGAVRGARAGGAPPPPAPGRRAAAARAPLLRAPLRAGGHVRRGRLPRRQPRRRSRRPARRLRLRHLRVRLRDASLRSRIEGAGGAGRRGERGRRLLPRVAHRGRRGRLHAHAGLPHAPRQSAAHARARAPALRALSARQRHRDAHALRARHRRQTGACTSNPGNYTADGEWIPAPHEVPSVQRSVPRAVGTRRARGAGRARRARGRRRVCARAALRAGRRRTARARLARRRALGARQATRVPQRGHATGIGAHAARASAGGGRVHPSHVAPTPDAPAPSGRAARARALRAREAAPRAHRRHAASGAARQVRPCTRQTHLLTFRTRLGAAAATASAARVRGVGRREGALPAAAHGARGLGGRGGGAAARGRRRARAGRRALRLRTPRRAAVRAHGAGAARGAVSAAGRGGRAPAPAAAGAARAARLIVLSCHFH